VRVAAGWQEVAGIDGADEERGRADERDEAEPAVILPPLIEGQPLDGRFEHLAKKTQPPRRYTEAALLSAMESAGKALSDEELRAAMKDHGLGTPATRAAIIETLLKRSYVVRDKKLLQPTAAGMGLIEALPVQSLASAELTGAWEARLARIARGEETRVAFLQDIATYVRETVEAIVAAEPPTLTSAAAMVQDAPAVGRCPRCGGAVRERSGDFSCGGCAFTLRKNVAGRAISAKLASVLLAKRRSEVLRGFRSKAGKKFAAALVLEDDGSLRFAFDGAPAASPARSRKPAGATVRPRKPAAAVGRVRKPTGAAVRPRPGAEKRRAPAPPISELPCPRCKQGTLVAGKRGWGCGRWREGCRFVIWFETVGRALSESQLRDLILRGKTRRARFCPGGGTPIEGRLILDPTSDGGARFSPG
jgi:DNA topoisomerase-3